MNLRRLLSRVFRSASVRIASDARGAAAVEFAVITPVILAMFFGTVELSTGVAADRKVTITARALSDIIAQSTTISDADMTNIFNAAGAILTPYPSSPLAARVSAINVDAGGATTVGWSDAYGTGLPAYAANTTVTIPAALRVANSQIIWSEVSYGYQSLYGKFIVGTLNLTDQFFARPRQSSTICRPPTVTTCS